MVELDSYGLGLLCLQAIQKHTQQLMAVLLLKALHASHTMDAVTHM